MKKYKIIYADPPWSYNDKMNGHTFSLDHEYQTQSLAWIKKLKVGEIADRDCALFLWAVSPQLSEALDVIDEWGFKFKTVAFVWHKIEKNGSTVSNLGRWTMGSVELLLLATKGKPKRIRRDVKQFQSAIRHGHSEKPNIFRKLIVELMGDVPRIELFARGNRDGDLFGFNKFEGWDLFGDECESNVDGIQN